MGSMWVNQDDQQWLFSVYVGLAAKEEKRNATKKSFQPLLGQKKLSFTGQSLHTNNDEPKSVPESESVACSASTFDNDSGNKKGNSFRSG